MVLTIGYFLLALLLLVFVHEFGHFVVARFCGVKVLRFSFGFGRVIASKRDKQGTEYVWSLVPLGGYVKMLDESEGYVPPSERHRAFNNKPLWMRAAIVIAGPLFNFIFAWVALWLALVIGIISLAPIIGHVQPHSLAAQAGLKAQQEIIALEGKKVESWHAFQYALMPFLGSHRSVMLTVKSLKENQQDVHLLPLTTWSMDVKHPDVLFDLGITPFIPRIPPIIGEVIPASPAALAGLRIRDSVTEVNGKPLKDWLQLVDVVKKHPNKSIMLMIRRGEQLKSLHIRLGQEHLDGKTYGYLGLRSTRLEWPSHWLRVHREAPIAALGVALQQTVSLTKTTFILLGRLAIGHLPLQSISGPVGIAEGAGAAGRSGFAYYLSFLALVSISLGVLNLLPIPLLDGGHLFYYLIEWIKQKPISNGIKSMGSYLGLFVLMILMVIALTNDIIRLTG